MEDINRLKIVLAEKKKTGKWLAETLGKDQTTVSKWCTNTSQPPDFVNAYPKNHQRIEVRYVDVVS